MLPTPVLAAVLAVALAVPLLGWALLARPQDAAARTRANLARGLDLPGAAPARPRSRLLRTRVRRPLPRRSPRSSPFSSEESSSSWLWARARSSARRA